MKQQVERHPLSRDWLAPLREWMRRLAAQLAAQVVQNVPEDLCVCEYECRDPRCNRAKLAVCVKHASHRESLYLRVESEKPRRS
jgi:hypothetical protein